jgi:hypothetical protein
MGTCPVLVLILVIVAVLVAVVAVGGLVDQGYRRKLQAWATARGWAYRENGGGDWAGFLPKGRRRHGVKIQLDGTWQGRPVTLADYWYQTIRSTGRTRTTRTHHLTAVVVRLAAPYPAVVLHSRALGSLGLGIAQAVGLHPANLTGIPEFDSRFRIETGPHSGSELVTAQVIHATLQGNLPPWQLHGHDLIIAWPGSLNVPDLDRKLSQALTLAAQLDRSS